MTVLAIAVIALAAVGLVAVYLVWLGGRHDRLTARADGAWAALDAQLARRAAAARARCRSSGGEHAVLAAADVVLARRRETAATDEPAGRRERPRARAASHGLGAAAAAEELPELRRAAQRVLLARQFHNDAVRDLLALRAGLPRACGRGRAAGTQRYFEIDDTVLTGRPPAPIRRPVTR